jgi:hypothetical protein
MGYLFLYLVQSPKSKDISQLTMTAFNAERRMTLISTAYFIAMSFGFLGFALFLIDAKGTLEGEATVENYKIKIARVSPGIFAMLCATIIIVVCGTFKIEYSGSDTQYGENSGTVTIPQFNRDSTLRDTGNHVDIDFKANPGKTKKK